MFPLISSSLAASCSYPSLVRPYLQPAANRILISQQFDRLAQVLLSHGSTVRRDRSQHLQMLPTFRKCEADLSDTGGEGSLTQWVHCEFVVSFEVICPVITRWICTLNQAHHLREGLNYSGRGSPVRGHPYVIALEGSCRGHAYRYSHQRNSDQSGGWGGEVSDSVAEGSGSRGSHSD